MKLSKKVVIIITAVLVLLIGGGVAYATNTPTARAECQLNLGNKYLQDGKYQEAILAFEKVIEIEPKNIPARLGLGNAYIATKEFDKAEAVLKEVIEIDQSNIPAREALFNVYMKEGNLDNANTILKGISQIDPNKDVKQFNTDLESAKAINASKASFDQGIKQMGDKQYLEAVDSFQKVIKEDTERYTDAQAKIGDCKKTFVDVTLQKAKDVALIKGHQTALDLLEQVLKVDPNNQDALKLKSDYTNTLEQIKKVQETQKTEQVNSVNNNQFTYRNTAGGYGFTINIPESWNGKYVVEEKDDSDYHFINFLYKGKFKEYIFSIATYNGSKDELGPEQIILGTKNGVLFCWSHSINMSEELHEELMPSDFSDFANKVIGSFRII
ncbi:MAG: hypothetical protein APF81_08995 [Desulfosporosinus sp. BRH_c37]|nr:MAG: hypothetical protein APF81_08995 [Desulfosporosinus sp. BRH_c37]